jgi:alkylhydroperoxidase/carboxymuconolactone decarboxylase family protein YurZ
MSKVPDHYRTLRDEYPEYVNAIENLGATVRKLGPLGDQTCQLMQLAASAALRSEGAVHSHARRAREAGVTVDELKHGLLCLTSTIGFPAVSAAMSWLDDLE